MTFFHDVLLALADVAKTDDPDQMTRLFFERLHGIDNRFSFEFMDREPRAGSGSLVMPIATPSATYGYVVAGGPPGTGTRKPGTFFKLFSIFWRFSLKTEGWRSFRRRGSGRTLAGKGEQAMHRKRFRLSRTAGDTRSSWPIPGT